MFDHRIDHTPNFISVSQTLKDSQNAVLVAHTRPDPDAVGSVLALKYYIRDNYPHITLTLACFSKFPLFLEKVFEGEQFSDPSKLNLEEFDVAIGCDSVDRGFNDIVPQLSDHCTSIIFDHHHDITLNADYSMIDPHYASTTELLFDYFTFDHGTINHDTATALLAGILGDTGMYHHPNTSPTVLATSAQLIQMGASLAGISHAAFDNKRVDTLNLWGRALQRVSFIKDKRIAITALTWEDMSSTKPTSEEIKEVASILTNSPDVDVALILLQIGKETIKASLRSTDSSKIDVSSLAHALGGGGHPRAAGFEVPGQIVLTADGRWSVV